MLRDDMRKIAEEDDPKKAEEEQTETVTEGVGGLIGFASGAAAGLTLGPVGAVIGALAGGAGGWWAGKQVGDAALEFEDKYYRRIHEASHAPTPSYEDVRHAYQLGHLAGRNPEYRDSDFDAIEPELQRAWKTAHGGSDNWNQVRSCVDRGFTHAREKQDEQRD
jgi:hypothetical protein